MITIKDLNFSYDRTIKVLDSLCLTLIENKIHGIVGLNGSGKTTLLNTVYGLLIPDNGEINHDGKKVTKKEMSFLETENFFYSNITGREYLSLFKNQTFDMDKWNRLFSLPLDKIIDGYSSGMKKKLALMGVLKQDKPIMILDEPFNGLDIETCRIIRSLLLRMTDKGKTIIITSHIIETLTNLCDFIHYLENGTIKQTREKDDFAEFERELFESIENKNIELITDLIV
jgi:ABC-2 type transport system ATP-binding protein